MIGNLESAKFNRPVTRLHKNYAVPDSAYYLGDRHFQNQESVGDWQRSLKRLVKIAAVPNAHAHRFRDTFAVELLLAGVSDLNMFLFFLAIEASASRRSTTRLE